MIINICVLVLAVVWAIDAHILSKRIKELENVVYYQMDSTHYPAIKNEFDSVWRAIKELNPGDEDDEE